MKKQLLIVLFVMLTLLGCEKKEEEVTPVGKPWEVEMLMGNFSINTADIVTNQDGNSLNYLTDYVDATKLPTANLEFFSLNAYIPTVKGYSVTIKNPSVKVSIETGASSSNIYYDSDYVGLKTFGDQQYAVYTIQGNYTGSTAVTRSNFANVVFTLTAVYEDDKGETVETRNVNLEVYKRGTVDGDTGGTIGGDNGGDIDTGGNTGGGDTGGSTYGNYIFWTRNDLGCGNITVTVNGVGSALITQYYSSGAPGCGAVGCANFELPAGTYYFTASCGDYSWSSSPIEVTAGSCNQMELK